MRNKVKTSTNMLVIAAIVLSLACLYACSTTRNTDVPEKGEEKADSVKEFVPTHPPVVIPHSWRDRNS